MAAGAINRAETLVLVPANIGTVGGRYENYVALIALDVLKILDEQGLLSASHLLLVGDCGRIIPELAVEQLFDELALLEVQGDDTEGFIRVAASTTTAASRGLRPFSKTPSAMN
jgi:hypothetical protein